MPTADVNWLLSTEVQSGAALVAIVGGLLVTRLASLSGERTFLRRSIRDARIELAQAQEAQETGQTELDRLRANGFRRHAKRSVLFKSRVYSPQELSALIAESGYRLSDDGVSQLVEPWVTQVREAFEQASEYVATHESREITPASVQAAVRAAVSGIAPELAEDVVDELTTRGTLGHTVVTDRVARTLAAVSSSPVTAADRQTRDRRMDEARNRVELGEYAVRAAKARLASLEDTQSQVARPEGLRRIFTVLAYLAAVCIVGPLALMAWGRTALPAWSRGLVVASFISGLIAFLLVVISLLRDHPERDRNRTTGQPARDGTEDAPGPDAQV
ncbi:MAG: hypothetical protein ACR2MP_34125 [Streptosporangiaceae bacterium]